MCGRYRNTMAWSDLRALMVLATPAPSEAPNMEANDDVRPTTQQWVIRAGEGGGVASKMRWGLVPYWFKGPTLKDFKITTFNAKAETVATSAAYKGPFARRRCLIPASGWYEWTGPKGGKSKHLFTARDGQPLTFAGLWETWRGPEGPVESFTIITQPAGAPLNAFHDRAPVVVFAAERARYLDLAQDPTPLLGPESPDHFETAIAA